MIGTSVKYAVGRVRPNPAIHTFEFKPFSGAQSFPSGHASQAFAVATAIAENYPAWWVQALCYGGAGLVGYARIEQNAHYTSDVVAGALLGWSVARSVVHRHDERTQSEETDMGSGVPMAAASDWCSSSHFEQRLQFNPLHKSINRDHESFLHSRPGPASTPGKPEQPIISR